MRIEKTKPITIEIYDYLGEIIFGDCVCGENYFVGCDITSGDKDEEYLLSYFSREEQITIIEEIKRQFIEEADYQIDILKEEIAKGEE